MRLEKIVKNRNKIRNTIIPAISMMNEQRLIKVGRE